MEIHFLENPIAVLFGRRQELTCRGRCGAGLPFSSALYRHGLSGSETTQDTSALASGSIESKAAGEVQKHVAVDAQGRVNVFIWSHKKISTVASSSDSVEPAVRTAPAGRSLQASWCGLQWFQKARCFTLTPSPVLIQESVKVNSRFH